MAQPKPTAPPRTLESFSLPEMMNNLRKVVLIPQHQEYIAGIRMLMADGMDESVDVPKVRQIYGLARTGKNIVKRIKQEKHPGNIQIPSLEKMVQDLNDASLAIVDEKDREFIQGIAMLIEMSHGVTQSDANQAKQIYITWQQNMHTGQTTKD